MSNETFLISMSQNNMLSQVAIAELRADLAAHPLNQRIYTRYAALPGNDRKYAVNQVKIVGGPLLNKKILFLGSSVTFGFGALGESFVDYLWKKDGIEAIKDAENGTTLIDQDTFHTGDSYVGRFKNELEYEKPDLLVVQLSTNDVKKGISILGKISNDHTYNLKTITGALEYIINTVQLKWHCPILIYTNPYFKNVLYKQMVERTHELATKYEIDILDLYNDTSFRKQSPIFMADFIHPTRAGYLIKWLPIFETKLINLLS